MMGPQTDRNGSKAVISPLLAGRVEIGHIERSTSRQDMGRRFLNEREARRSDIGTRSDP